MSGVKNKLIQHEMETQRLFIRPFSKDDWKDLYEYLCDENVVKYEPYEIYNEEACMKEAERRAVDTSFWGVCLKENGKLIGNIYFSQQEPKQFSTWELGYVFNPKYYGHGYATESAQKFLAYGFESCEARRIIAKCNPANVASWKLLERLHMRKESHMLQTVYFKRDKQGNPLWHDTYQYAMLSDEWFNRT